MKAEIEIVFITQNNPKLNYLFYAEKGLYKITKVDDNNVYAVNIEETFSSSDDIDTTVFNISDIKDLFIKFLANTDKLIFSIIRRDYKDIIEMLYNYYSHKKMNFNESIGKMISNNVKCTVEGKIIKISSKPKVESNVEICNINIIDNHNLHNKADRIFKISNYIYKGNNIVYTLENNKTSIRCGRDSFKTIDMPNHKNLFTLKI